MIIKPEPTKITDDSEAMQQLDDLIALQMGKAFDADLPGASIVSWVQRYRAFVEFEAELRVWDQQQPRDSETRFLDAMLPKLQQLETQVLQLSATCVQLELKRPRGYFDPQYALSVIGITAVTFVRALGALFFQVVRIGSFRSPAPQAVGETPWITAIDERLSRSELRDVDYALEVCCAVGKCGAEGTPEARSFEALHAKIQGMIRRMS